MKATQFKALLESLASLAPSQRKKLTAALSPTADPAAPAQGLERLQPGPCPHCTSEGVVRTGVADAQQRYLCRACSKTFNSTTGTPLSRLRDKERFEGYADCVRQGLSVRATAAFGAKVFVIEDLKGWRPKGPSKVQRKRFHRFQHRALLNLPMAKARGF